MGCNVEAYMDINRFKILDGGLNKSKILDLYEELIIFHLLEYYISYTFVDEREL